MTADFAPDLATLRRLVRVAREQEPADLVIDGGSLLNVFTEETLPGGASSWRQDGSPTSVRVPGRSQPPPGSMPAAPSSPRGLSKATPT